MLRIERDYFPKQPQRVREIAGKAGVARETLSRIINGKQQPGFGEGQSAERIAKALGYVGDPRELFEEV